MIDKKNILFLHFLNNQKENYNIFLFSTQNIINT